MYSGKQSSNDIFLGKYWYRYFNSRQLLVMVEYKGQITSVEDPKMNRFATNSN